jgi:chromosome segregation protein
MRAEKLSDLINNLSKRREAMVTITFNRGEADTPLVISRRIKEGSAGFNSVYGMGQSVDTMRTTTLTEIHDLLAQYRISPGCYNVMMQGDVAGIVHMSPVERRKILDELAGVAEFDRKIDQAERELEATGQNIERNVILLGEIELRLDQLGQERDTALKYQALKTQKQTAEAQLLVSRFTATQQAVSNNQTLMAEARKAKEAQQAAIRHFNTKLADTRNALTRLSDEIKTRGEDQYIGLKQQMESLKGHVARKQDVITHGQQQLVANQKTLATLTQEIERLTNNKAQVQSELDTLAHQRTELEALFNTEKASYQALNDRFDALTDSTGSSSAQRNALRKQLEALEDSLSQNQRQQLDVTAQIDRHKTDMAHRETLLADSSTQRQQLDAKLAVCQQQVKHYEDERDAFEAQLRAYQREVSELRVAVQQTNQTVQTLTRQAMQLDAQKKAYDDVYFGRAVDAILSAGSRGDIPGVHGTLAQLGSVDNEVALAMEIAIGGRIQNIVVDDDRSAQAGIDLLQQQRAGRATFLPLTKIQRARTLPVLPRGAGIIDFAQNLVQYDHQYHDIFAFALGETLIVRDMATARPLMRQYRMVTLDGSLLEKTGAMTGGSINKPNGGRSSGFSKAGSKGTTQGAGKDSDELRTINDNLARAEAEKDSLQKRLTQKELGLDRLKDDYARAMAQLSKVTAERDGVQGQLAQLQQKLAPKADQLPLFELLAELEADLSHNMAQQPVLEGQIAGLKTELTQLEQHLPTQAMEALRQELTEVRFQMDYYDTQLRNVQTDAKAKQLEQDNHSVGLTHAHERIATMETANQQTRAEKAAAEEEIALTQAHLTQLQAQTAQLDAEIRRIQDERDVVQNRLIEEEKAKYGEERQLAQIEEQLVSYQARQRELLPQLATVKAELVAGGLDPENLPPISEDEAAIQRGIQKLLRQMEALEPVNMRAIEEFDQVNGRRDELADKNNTLDRERQSLVERIESYQELKLSAFNTTFGLVDGHFKTIFAELADGDGQLTLTQPDAPFSGGLTIHAQPRGKKMQRLESMSGGEKSLTSLAFVFALQRVTPAPFYALDEVDMNLDGINAEKLANMVAREAQTAQFLVVSLRKPMLEHSDRTVGVTQRRDGATKVTGVKLRGDLPTLADAEVFPLVSPDKPRLTVVS